MMHHLINTMELEKSLGSLPWQNKLLDNYYTLYIKLHSTKQEGVIQKAVFKVASPQHVPVTTQFYQLFTPLNDQLLAPIRLTEQIALKACQLQITSGIFAIYSPILSICKYIYISSSGHVL